MALKNIFNKELNLPYGIVSEIPKEVSGKSVDDVMNYDLPRVKLSLEI